MDSIILSTELVRRKSFFFFPSKGLEKKKLGSRKTKNIKRVGGE